MSRGPMKVVAIGAVALVLVAGAAVAALALLVNTGAARTWAAQSASHALGRPVRFASFSVSALPLPSVRLERLEVADDPVFGPGPLLVAKEGRLGIRLRPLLSGRVELAEVVLEQPRLRVVEDARGRLNVARVGVPGTATSGPSHGPGNRAGAQPVASAPLSRLAIVDGAIEYRRLGDAASFRFDRVNLVARQDVAGQPMRVDGDARGQPGDVLLRIRNATVAFAESRQLGDAAVSATVELDARELSSLWSAALGSPDATGRITGSLEIAGTAGRLAVTGTIAAARLAIASSSSRCRDRAPRPLVLENLRIPLRGDLTRLDSAPAEAAIDAGTISVNASVTLSRPAVARLTQLAIRNLDLAAVLVERLCQPFAVTGRMDLDGDLTLGLDGTWRRVAGAGRFRIGPGKVVGADAVNLVRELAGVAVPPASARGDSSGGRSPLEFDSITASYTLRDGVARTDDLLYRARDVTVRAAGTYDLGNGRVGIDVTLTEGGNRIAGFVSGAPGSLRVIPTAVRLQDARDVRKFLGRLFR